MNMIEKCPRVNDHPDCIYWNGIRCARENMECIPCSHTEAIERVKRGERVWPREAKDQKECLT